MKAMYFFMWGKGVKVIGQCKVCEDIVRTKFDWGPQRGGGQLDVNFYSSVSRGDYVFSQSNVSDCDQLSFHTPKNKRKIAF